MAGSWRAGSAAASSTPITSSSAVSAYRSRRSSRSRARPASGDREEGAIADLTTATDVVLATGGGAGAASGQSRAAARQRHGRCTCHAEPGDPPRARRAAASNRPAAERVGSVRAARANSTRCGIRSIARSPTASSTRIATPVAPVRRAAVRRRSVDIRGHDHRACARLDVALGERSLSDPHRRRAAASRRRIARVGVRAVRARCVVSATPRRRRAVSRAAAVEPAGPPGSERRDAHSRTARRTRHWATLERRV